MNKPQMPSYQDPVLVIDQLALASEACTAFLLHQPGWLGE